LPATIKIEGNESTTSITLIKMDTRNCMGIFEDGAKENEKENLQKAFEIEFIDRIKNDN